MSIENAVSENIKILEGLLNKLPFAVVKNMKKEIAVVRELMVCQRSPRFMIIGRRGAGKSSLLNAIFNEKMASVGSVTSETGIAKWYTYTTSRGVIDLLDTRGLGDRTRPESANIQYAINDIYSAVDEVAPDAILFLCKAKEVDARICDDLKNVKAIISHIKTRYHYQPPVVGVVTQVDELDPLSDFNPPYIKKSENITLAVSALSCAFKSQGIDLLNIFPTSSYAEYDINCKPSFSKFWNINKLVEYLVDVLPRETQVQLVRMSNVMAAQEKTCRQLMHSIATICAGVATAPIPVADIFPITSLQIGLITSIGYISGRSLSSKNVRKFITSAGINIGGAFILREMARTLVKLVIPGVGSAISAGVAYAGTWAIGEAAIAYYIQGKNIIHVKRLVK
jgi:uncharacterized protein (DUF697 family)/GTPase Era involved in 16S rRNA processing